MSDENVKKEIFKAVQKFLYDPPVIIWGSGATIPYGMPSMDDLKDKLQHILQQTNGNLDLETALGKLDKKKRDAAKKIIRDAVIEKDKVCLQKSIQNTGYFESIGKMVRKFYNAHPRRIDIVTTNYDRVLEYALSQSNYCYTDGFSGRPLSKFSADTFGTDKIIYLIKVHGSLNWVSANDEIFFMPCDYDYGGVENVMLIPTKEKYEESYREPYRTLITKSDSVIQNAKSFLVIGFGFNDEHLTPKIETKIKNGTPIVIATKNATVSCVNKLTHATKYCLFQETTNGTSVVLNDQSDIKEEELAGNYWELGKFMEIL